MECHLQIRWKNGNQQCDQSPRGNSPATALSLFERANQPTSRNSMKIAIATESRITTVTLASIDARTVENGRHSASKKPHGSRIRAEPRRLGIEVGDR